MRGRPRRAAQLGAVGTMALLAGLVPSAGAEADSQLVDTEVSYSCVFPSGTHQVTVGLSARLPRSVAIDTPIGAEDVRLTFGLPRSALGGPPGTESSAVSGAVRLTTAVTQGGHSTDVEWEGLEVAERTAATGPDAATDAGPGEGPGTRDTVPLSATGEVPTLTPRSSGDVVLAAGPLSLALVVRTPDSAGEGARTITASCAVHPDGDTGFATVGVGAPGPGAPSAPTPPPGTEDGKAPAPDSGDVPAGKDPADGAGEPSASAFAAEEPEHEGCSLLMGVDVPPKAGHGYLAGFANAGKLDSAIAFTEPAHLRVNMAKKVKIWTCENGTKVMNELLSDATFDYHGKAQLPPTTATFITFGFMPTKATVEMSLEGPIEISTWADALPDEVTGRFPETSTAVGRMRVRLSDVEVNGEPLDVGPNCRSERPMSLVLTGKGTSLGGTPGEGYTVQDGGPLTGSPYLPPFQGCGTGEDLDSLFTAAVSGKGNYTKMTQAPLCVNEEGSPNQAYCPDPPRPVPQR
ncbi:hypothetical protein PZB75_27610 [Streptomyces sp. AM 4-1-1]|uniref:DUF6801 domain-containing protein n=1 Tax=Streptomyces sp. AM 4-1-1 TaxID=3028710 RepID=UPI0023B980A4|nr:DUF6801 domain-containing protein [Streptomyces sp. AM 4-1-1]WEH36790.1 hypothetical protein PZB75_27610 [Streptomyces sp. AM 4-1-1]